MVPAAEEVPLHVGTVVDGGGHRESVGKIGVEDRGHGVMRGCSMATIGSDRTTQLQIVQRNSQISQGKSPNFNTEKL